MNTAPNLDRSVNLALLLRRWWSPIWLTAAIVHALLFVAALRIVLGDSPARLRFLVEPVAWFVLPLSVVCCFLSLRKWRRGPERAIAHVLTGSPEER